MEWYLLHNRYEHGWTRNEKDVIFFLKMVCGSIDIEGGSMDVWYSLVLIDGSNASAVDFKVL